ncbi:MAG: ABC transporter substrate-binding protein, partial [Candidatus Izemoplasmataceae bacterium]
TGTYEIDIEVTNSFGEKAEATITIEVVEEGEVIAASGTYNFKYVDSEIRHTLFAAAERYLMETVYGGVPSTINAGYALYSERTQLPVEDPVPVMDYGTMFGDFSDYDDEVVMDDGNPGEDDEKTWRAAETNDPGQYNHWEYDDSISADFLTLMQDSLYYFDFNDDKTGYEVLPSMADGMPTPVDDYENDFGVTLSDEWHVSIRDDLEWYFHDETLDEYSDLSNGDEIDAQQFIDTYKLALDNEWFRAISGGGDFTTAPQKIKNAQEYADGEEGVEWEDVGLKVEDGDLVFEFEEDIDEWGVIYWLSSFVTTPINLELYDLLEADGETYGVSEQTTAYHGPYYLDYYEADKVLRFKENPEFHSPDRYDFTGHTYQIIEDSDIRFQEFLNGNLDAVEVPSTQYESYQNDPRIKAIPGATTFRASINSLGTVEAQQEQFGEGSDFEPEPLLAWEGDEATFRNALYHAWDRETIADSVQVTNEPAMYYFSEAYLVAPQEGVSFREWDNLEANKREYIDTLDSEDDFDQDDFDDWLDENRDPDASIVGEGLGTDTLGYNPDLARAIFRDAMDDLVDDGEYELGTPDDPLEIELQFTIQSGSSAQTAYAEFMKDELEEIFDYQNDDGETLAYVTLDIDPVEFPDNYYTRILVGQTDMGMGGISGSTLDAASFLDVFCDDNRGGFTMDWGIDTSSANIEVTYENETGTEVTELWSYNALVSALNQTTRVSNGEEAE